MFTFSDAKKNASPLERLPTYEWSSKAYQQNNSVNIPPCVICAVTKCRQHQPS